MHKSGTRRGLLVLGSILAGVLLWAGLLAAIPGRASNSGAPDGTPSRRQNPVTVVGAGLPAFSGAPLADLALYRYHDSAWEPVPYQFDEVTAGGLYTTTEDGLLDENDELVFMALDGGVLVEPTTWPEDAESRLHPRQVVTVTDPLSGDDLGWFYLYRSTTLPRSGDAYITWDEPAQTLTGISYTMAFESDDFFGISDLSLNGQTVDILDRQKLRGQVTIINPIFTSTMTFNEETVTQFITQPLTVTLPIIGPIRAVGDNDIIGYIFYGTEANVRLSLPLEDTEIAPLTILHFDFMRLSLDLLNPAGNGFAPARYYDSNGADVAIDGVGDGVAPAPPVSWTQTAGAYGGWVAVSAVNPAAGSLTNHYLDDSTPDPEDTGDMVSFGDAGFRVDHPNGTVEVGQSLVVLPAGTGNTGAAVSLWPGNPLATSITLESFETSEDTIFVYVPLVLNQE